jgi:zinc protease
MTEVQFGVALPARRGFSVPIQVFEHAGITAWLVEDHSIPVVSVAWSWDGGQALEPEGREGLAGMAASMLTEGAGDLRSVEFTDALSDEGIALGFSARADVFEGSFRTLTDALPQAVPLARLAMTAPRLDEDALVRVRARALLAARQQLESPAAVARRAFWEAAFPNSTLGRAATPESINSIIGADIRAALDAQLHRGGVQVVAAGALDAAGLRAVIGELFGALPAGEPPTLTPPAPMAAFGQVLRPMPGPQAHMVFGQGALPPTDPDWEASQVVIRILAGGGFSSRLMRTVREERGLTYGIGAGLSVAFGQALVQGYVATENAQASEVWRLVREAWTEMAESGPTEEELRDAVAFLAGSLPLQFTDSRRSASLLLGLRQTGRTPEWLAGRPARLAALTRDQVARTAGRMLQTNSLALAVAGQPQGL